MTQGMFACRHSGTMRRMEKRAEQRLARLATPRLARELKTIKVMLRIACRDRHGTGEGLCAGCAALLEYAIKRLVGCPYGAEKPTCANCQVHCYGPREREQVREMMRYAGPRMMTRHPYLALMHVIDGRRPAPPKPRGARVGAAASDPASEPAASAPLSELKHLHRTSR
ncbi:MAG TPA: nitrous oxide-stimulated promoter family protein [Burkholderiaceae bacterium]|nr:nitrous oxide-stimulated promoter family protein [Burkholderiaceae bacterium]